MATTHGWPSRSSASARSRRLNSSAATSSAFAAIPPWAAAGACSQRRRSSPRRACLRRERPHTESRGSGGITQQPPRKPLIAAVEGFAVALGFEIVLSCDLIVAARDARFGIPEVKRSLVALAGGLIRLPKRVPYHLA